MPHLLLALLASLLLLSCAPSQFLRKSYPPQQLQDQSILVYPVSGRQVQVSNADDFADDFEGVTLEAGEFMAGAINDAAYRYFEKSFKVKLAFVEDSVLGPLPERNSFKVTEKIGKEPFEIRVPRQEFLSSKGINSRFVLVMDQITFGRNLRTYQHMHHGAPQTTFVGGKAVTTGGPPMMVTSSSKSIAMGVNYVIYDYQENAVAGYGYASGEKNFKFVLTQSDWYKAMDKALASIKKFAPF